MKLNYKIIIYNIIIIILIFFNSLEARDIILITYTSNNNQDFISIVKNALINNEHIPQKLISIKYDSSSTSRSACVKNFDSVIQFCISNNENGNNESGNSVSSGSSGTNDTSQWEFFLSKKTLSLLKEFNSNNKNLKISIAHFNREIIESSFLIFKDEL
ncbi:MAG: hypothetical protein HQK51_16535 [Oligoflexia bacterium]|nr:hypothetical protein [Oligoflexia bacterium]